MRYLEQSETNILRLCNYNYNEYNCKKSQEAGASRNNIEKEPQKPHPKLKKYVFIKYLERVFVLPAVQCKWYSFANMH